MLNRLIVLAVASSVICGCQTATRSPDVATAPPIAGTTGTSDPQGATAAVGGASAGAAMGGGDHGVKLAAHAAPVISHPDRDGAPLPHPSDPLPHPGPPVVLPRSAPSLFPVPAGQTALTLADLEQTALANNPAVAEAAARAEAARGNWLQVGLPPNPVIGYSGEQLGTPQVTQEGVSVGQEIVTGGKLRLNRQVAAWQVEQAERVLAATRLRVVTDVRIAYYQAVVAQRRRETVGQLTEVSRQAVEAAEALLRAQEVSQADPLRARIEADSVRILARSAQNQYRAAWRTLAAAAGVPEMVPVPLADEIDPESLRAEWQQELERLLRESPQLAAAVAQVEASRWTLQRAKAEVIPNIAVQAVFQHDNSVGSDSTNLAVTVPLPLFDRNQGGVREAQAELVASQRAVDRLTLNLQTRLAEAFQRYETASDQAEIYVSEGGILQNAERTLTLVRTGYAAGEFSVLDLVTAQQTYFEKTLAYLDALNNLLTARSEIRGLMLRGSLDL